MVIESHSYFLLFPFQFAQFALLTQVITMQLYLLLDICLQLLDILCLIYKVLNGLFLLPGRRVPCLDYTFFNLSHHTNCVSCCMDCWYVQVTSLPFVSFGITQTSLQKLSIFFHFVLFKVYEEYENGQHFMIYSCKLWIEHYKKIFKVIAVNNCTHSFLFINWFCPGSNIQTCMIHMQCWYFMWTCDFQAGFNWQCFLFDRTGQPVRCFWMWNGPFERDFPTNPP